MNKDKFVNYCEKLEKLDVKHIEEAVENKYLVEKGKYRQLNGCPQNFGVDDYVGLCEIEEVQGIIEQTNQCERCWKKALNVNNS